MISKQYFLTRRSILRYILGILLAQVVKLVDTPDLGSGAAKCVGSSPILGITLF